MTSYTIFGCVVAVVGISSVLARKFLMKMAADINKRSGVPAERLDVSKLERGYVFGGVAMAVLGVITALYGIVTGT